MPENWGGDIPWITPNDLSGYEAKTINAGERSLTEVGYDSCSTQLVKAGTVLFTSRAPIGYVAIAARPVCTNQGFKSFEPSEALTSDYLYWFLKAAAPDIRKLGSGTTFPELSKKKAAEIVIPVPPLAEQRRIVATIEEHISRLDSAETSLHRAQSRVGGLRSSVITSHIEGKWPRLAWKDVARSQNGRAFPSRDYSGEGVKLLRPGNLHASGRVVWTEENTRRLPFHYRDEFASYLVGAHELVMNLTAQSLKDEFLGRVCVTGPEDHCLLNQRLARLTPFDADADARYLLYVLKAGPFRRFVDSLNKGSLIQHMFTSQLDEFELPVPPIQDQHRIVDQIERELSIVDALAATIATGLRRSAALRRSILEQALAGMLVPQDPTDEPASVLLQRIAAERTTAPRPTRRRKKVKA